MGDNENDNDKLNMRRHDLVDRSSRPGAQAQHIDWQQSATASVPSRQQLFVAHHTIPLIYSGVILTDPTLSKCHSQTAATLCDSPHPSLLVVSYYLLPLRET